LIKNFQPFGEKFQKTVGGDFFDSHCISYYNSLLNLWLPFSGLSTKIRQIHFSPSSPRPRCDRWLPSPPQTLVVSLSSASRLSPLLLYLMNELLLYCVAWRCLCYMKSCLSLSLTRHTLHRPAAEQPLISCIHTYIHTYKLTCDATWLKPKNNKCVFSLRLDQSKLRAWSNIGYYTLSI